MKYFIKGIKDRNYIIDAYRFLVKGFNPITDILELNQLYNDTLIDNAFPKKLYGLIKSES